MLIKTYFCFRSKVQALIIDVNIAVFSNAGTVQGNLTFQIQPKIQMLQVDYEHVKPNYNVGVDSLTTKCVSMTSVL